MIRNLLFDLGGVIMDLDRDRCVAEFKKFGMADADSFFGLYEQKGPFMELESGAIGPEEFRRRLRAILPDGGADLTDTEIDNALFLFLAGIPAHRLESLRDMRLRGYKIYLLSNTNPIMWNGFIADEFPRSGGHPIDWYFDGTVTSFEAGICKPAAEIFDYACRKLCIKPEETLFFDDSAANCAAAAALGFATACVAPGMEMAELLPDD
jgi:putative hydrolase of the HAD superfamily